MLIMWIEKDFLYQQRFQPQSLGARQFSKVVKTPGQMRDRRPKNIFEVIWDVAYTLGA